jgi:hypothetical protein
MMTFFPQSFDVALQSFGVATAGFVALLSAIVIFGIWEGLRQEMKLRKAERERRREAARPR